MKSILTIAGSDSCAGAGMQIDMKTAMAHGVYVTCAVTALTAQNTSEVRAVQLADPEVLAAQIRAVFDDIPPGAVKIGMLGSAELAQVVARELRQHPSIPVVLDPVLVATAGAELTEAATCRVLRDELAALSCVVTPNLPEAAALTGADVASAQGVEQAALEVLSWGAQAVLVKGGHGDDAVIVDSLFVRGDEPQELPLNAPGEQLAADPGVVRYELYAQRLPGEFHGTGCATATAIACNLARGMPLAAAARAAHSFIIGALAHATGLGHGTTIFDPLYQLVPSTGRLGGSTQNRSLP